MTINGLQMDGFGTDSRPAKIMRAGLGAFYGFLAGTAFAVIASFIDIWLHRDLPLGVDWQSLWTRLPFFGLGLALVGAATCWWNEAWPGLLSGAATASALALIIALSSTSSVGIVMKFVVLVFILVPVAAMMVPLAWIMRWLVERHIGALNSNRMYGRVVGLVVLTMLLGATGGYFMKMSAKEIEATRYIHTLLQGPLEETSPLSKVDGISAHQGMPYRLYANASKTSTEGFDVHARFEDGYAVKCMAVLYPSRPPYISGCASE